ncbi:hypothetical protein AC579_7238 [Pseudocercospora musae]|nr:hypothetical protein AC579_7238 [Pseudocercospora musae]
MTFSRTKSMKARQRSTTSHKTSARCKGRRTATKSYEKCHKVISTAELLEMILLAFLETETQDVAAQKALLSVQKVSHSFEDVIKGSFKLQRALCFLPDLSKALPSDTALISPLLLPYGASRISRPIFPFVYTPGQFPFGPSSGAAFAIKIADKVLALGKNETWQ